MKKALLTLIAFVTISATNAQDQNYSGEFWLGTQFLTPMSDFKDKIDRDLGIGGNIGGLWNPSKRNNFFQVGGEFGLLYMGKDKKIVDELSIKTTNAVFLMHAIARFRIQTTSNIKPYIDIVGGSKLFSTTTKFNNDIIDTILEIENRDILGEQTNGAWSYGVGIGFSKVGINNIGYDVKLTYMKGSSATYIAPENFYQDTNGDFFYEHQEVNKTDMVSLSVSFIGLLNKDT